MSALPKTNIGMRPTTFANPMGVDGFEFIEFAAPQAQPLHDLFRQLGFVAVAHHKSRAITLYRQGDCNFLVNEQADSFAAEFARHHGPCACGFALRFSQPAHQVLASVLAKGATEVTSRVQTRAVATPVIEGIGGCMLYLVDRYGERGSLFDDYAWRVPEHQRHPTGFGITFIDHLTHNLRFGEMADWANYYERLFNFREIHYFDIKGARTGLVSKAMTAPDGMVRIPLNESSDPKSQINEFLDEYRGAGIQHIALFTNDIHGTVEQMRAAGVQFLATPDTYFEAIDRRLPGHGEDVARLASNRILIDADLESRQKLS